MSLLKSVAMKIPVFRSHMQRMEAMSAELDKLRSALAGRSQNVTVSDSPVNGDPRDGWADAKRRRQELSRAFQSKAATSRVSALVEPVNFDINDSIAQWFRHQVEAEQYWFQKIDIVPGLSSPGWSDPVTEKLPYFGLPDDLTGKRVLDIGCGEGFFTFEAERRGAREVIGIDSFPDSIRRFHIVKAARQSNASAFLMNVYDLEPRRLGTFDLVLFFGVFYHLKHPQLGLERIRSICVGDLLFQTPIFDDPSMNGIPWARFYPYGMASGINNEFFDPTVFWVYNSACCLAMLDHVGFRDMKIISTSPHPFVIHASSSELAQGIPPDQTDAPWC